MASESINMSDNRPSGKSKSAYTMCNREVLYHGFLCFVAIVVIVTQATVLNFYIIAYYREFYHHVRDPAALVLSNPDCLFACYYFHPQVATYFLFLGDLFIVCIFAISFTTAYRYIHLR
jgi:hypothetical protein